MAIAVGLLFWGVQMITDNFLTPKIVGNSLKVNALTTILSLIIGAAVWGVAGMILFLPFVAMFKVVCEEYEELKPVALLIGNQNYQENGGSGKFISKWFKKIKSYFLKLYIAFKKK
jgi:predicted PurR-regulated permease PerM